MLVRDKVSDSKNNEDDWKEKQNTKQKQPGGNIALWLEYLLPSPAAPGLTPSVPEFFSEEYFFDISERR